jgi:outer membrane lipoprotein-sorting protein
MLMPLVVLLLLPAAEPNEAEKLFRDMEKKITSAKTLECDFETTLEGGAEFKMTGKGSLTLAEGNKCRMELNGEAMGKTFKGTVTSDGTNLQSAEDGKVQPKVDTPKQLGDLLRAGITRAGVLSTIVLRGDPMAKEFKIDEVFKVSDFKLGKKEKIGAAEAQEIQYALNGTGMDTPMTVSVWVDTKTNLPLKRVMSTTLMGNKIMSTETCPKMTLDPKVDPKKFELPKE